MYKRKIIWFILNFGPQGYTSDMAASFGAKLGSLPVPLLAPVGLGFWQIVVALIAGISAKDVVVPALLSSPESDVFYFEAEYFFQLCYNSSKQTRRLSDG
ncbi:hypothetical protein [Hungatella sp. SB206]|uniref:hypothetical protein n=2 Tax=Hungatella TaxID=1649459 RepID=UPI003DA7F345